VDHGTNNPVLADTACFQSQNWTLGWVYPNRIILRLYRGNLFYVTGNRLTKTVLVTGGARRVGRAICTDLATEGYKVGVHYNTSADYALSLVEELSARGLDAFAIQADLSNEQQTRELIAKATQIAGPIGILVNNASVFEEDFLDAEDPKIWNQHFDLHVKAPSILSAAFAENLPEQSNGLIVNMIDQRVLKLNPNFYSYTLSKSVLWTATRTMAQTLAPRIRVNAIGPGPTLPSYRQSEDQFQRQVETLPLQIAPDLAEFASTILYFAKTPSVTGQMISLDGGQHLAWQTDDLKVPE